MKDPLSALGFLSKHNIYHIEYIRVRWENRTTPIQVEITPEGRMLLEASDAFYEFLISKKVRVHKDLHKTHLTPDRENILCLLKSGHMSLSDLQERVGSIVECDGVIHDLLATLERQKYIVFSQETETYSATKYGLIALEATEVFYQRLTELGFFEDRDEDIGEDNGKEEGLQLARDAFADFDGGLDLERGPGAAE